MTIKMFCQFFFPNPPPHLCKGIPMSPGPWVRGHPHPHLDLGLASPQPGPDIWWQNLELQVTGPPIRPDIWWQNLKLCGTPHLWTDTQSKNITFPHTPCVGGNIIKRTTLSSTSSALRSWLGRFLKRHWNNVEMRWSVSRLRIPTRAWCLRHVWDIFKYEITLNSNTSI